MAASTQTLEPVLKDFYPKKKKSKDQLLSPVVKGGALKGLRQDYERGQKKMMKDTNKTTKAADSRRAAAKRMYLGQTLMEKGGKSFEEKVAYVKQHMPDIEDPEGFVAAALREVGELA